MTLVLEESEDISLELLTPILDTVKNDNQVIYYLSYSLQRYYFFPPFFFSFLFFN